MAPEEEDVFVDLIVTDPIMQWGKLIEQLHAVLCGCDSINCEIRVEIGVLL